MYDILGARAIDVSGDAERRAARRRKTAEDVLLPIATTEETAAAWRRWREAGKVEAEAAIDRPGRPWIGPALPKGI